MLPLIIVRPEPGASATADRARALGLMPIILPLFRIAPISWKSPDPAEYDALMLTSANAVAQAGPALDLLRGLPCHAVGKATAAAARSAGLSVVVEGMSGGQALVDAAAEEGARSLLWLCGSERTALSGGTARITPLPVYESAALTPPAGWDAAIAAPAVLMLHSVRAAAYARSLAGTYHNHLIILAISAAVADAAGDGWAEKHCAAIPDDSAMLASARTLCQTLRD